MKVTINFNTSLGSDSLLFEDIVRYATAAGDFNRIGHFQGVSVHHLSYEEAFKLAAQFSLLTGRHEHPRAKTVSIHIMDDTRNINP
jgi:hypothetical protein